MLPLFAIGFFLLPFVVLLRGAEILNQYVELNPWICTLAGAFFTLIILIFYFSWLWKRLKGKKKLNPRAKSQRWWIAGGLTLLYLFYGLTFISSNNAKTKKIKSEYGELHPFLRMGVGTIALLDRELVVTDLKRNIEDYENMGLSKKKKSLHYPQEDGFVHAVDLRTNNRAEWRNTFLKFWFLGMGFQVHRHVGTADHLHVSIGNKKGIW